MRQAQNPFSALFGGSQGNNHVEVSLVV